MDWFKKKNSASAAPVAPAKSASPPPNVGASDATVAGEKHEPTAEEKLEAMELETKETIAEYVRKLESLALVIFEKSEENESLMEKLRVQEQDMQVLLDKMVAQEKDLETYKENQVEYKRRLEVLTDCLEDLARENMKLAARGAPASMPEDYEEERFPTQQEIHIQKTKSNVAAESAARSGPTKSASRSLPPSQPPPLTVAAPRPSNDATQTSSASPVASSTTTSSKSADPTSKPTNKPEEVPPASTSPTKANTNEKEAATAEKDLPPRRYTASPAGGLVLPSKSKSKPDVRDSNSSRPTDTSPSAKSASTSEAVSTSTSTSKHKRVPSGENDFTSMAGDPKALMVVLKKYKAQADSLRRDLIREKQKSESLQLSIDKYETKAVVADKSYRDSLVKESKRRKDAEYIANVLKKRVTELQFLLDEKDDSDHDSDSDKDEPKKNDDSDGDED